MEFKVNSKVLEKVLNKTIPAVPNRTPMQILENFLFDVKDGALTVSATDLEIALVSSINVASDENIKMVLPARLVFDIIRSLSETQIHFQTADKQKVTLTTDNGTYKLSYLSADEFPEIPQVDKEKEISINGLQLKKAIDQGSFAMSHEDMRPAMTGTLFEFAEDGLRFVTTDGHRLVKYINKNLKADEKEQYIVPGRAISVLSKILTDTDIKIYWSSSYVYFDMGDLKFISRLIGEKYPAYESVIPLENENILKVNKNEILSTVRRMMLFSSSNSKQVKLSIGKEVLEISAEDIDKGSTAKETIACSYSGEAMEIGFNTLYLNDIISHLESDEIIFKLHSPTKACIIVPSEIKEDEDLMLLLMPVRLNN